MLGRRKWGVAGGPIKAPSRCGTRRRGLGGRESQAGRGCAQTLSPSGQVPREQQKMSWGPQTASEARLSGLGLQSRNWLHLGGTKEPQRPIAWVRGSVVDWWIQMPPPEVGREVQALPKSGWQKMKELQARAEGWE